MKTAAYRLIAVGLIGVALTFTSEVFLTSANLLNVLRQASLTFLIASGLTLTILTAGLDLSVGANVGLSACLAATVMKSTGSIALGAAAGLGFGVLVGALNGLMITLLRLPPFIATYGMLWTLNGVTYWFMGGETIHGFSPGFRQIGSGYWLGVPVPIYVMAAFLVAGGIFTRYTTFGHEVYAIGANREAARLSGVPVRARLNLVYILSGAMAGLAAIVYLARLNSAEADIGEALTLPAIAAVLIGGTSLFGGSGGLTGTLVGAVTLTLVVNGMNLLAVDANWQPLVTGVIVILSVWIDVVTKTSGGESMRRNQTQRSQRSPRKPILVVSVIFAISVLFVTSPAFSQTPAAGRCAAALLNAPFSADAGPSWNGWGAGAANTRFQAADQAGITAAQVPNLKLKWAFAFPEAVSSWSQPTVVGGRIFIGSMNGTVYSLDAKTGCTYWTYRAQAPVRAATTVGARRNAAGERAYTVYVGDAAAHVYALDAQTGDLLWAHKVDDQPSTRVTGAPTFYQDRLYVPVASQEEAVARNGAYPCCKFRGNLVVLDLAGNTVWKTYMLPENAKPLGKTSAGTQRWGPSGAGIWSSPTIDPVRKVVYVSTGNQYTEPQLTTSDSVVAIDLESGKIKWSSQRLEKDVWVVGCPSTAAAHNCNSNASDIGPDYDLGDSPILTKLPNGKDVIIVGQKSGQGWALDPEKKGAVIWEYRAGRGTALGGIEWGPAVDAQNAYFAVSDFNLPNPGGLHAVNLATGQRAWLTPAPAPICTAQGPGCSGVQSAAITVIPGIVFSGAMDGGLRAYSTTDGSIVWTFDANKEFPTVNGVKGNGASFGGAGPSVAGGMLFVGSGYGSLAGRAGNVLLAFGVE